VEVRDGEAGIGLELGEAEYVGQVFATSRARPRSAHHARLRKFLNNDVANIESDFHEQTLSFWISTKKLPYFMVNHTSGTYQCSTVT